MGAIDTKVTQHHVRRAENGNVKGTLQLNIGPFQHDQDYDYKGEMKIVDTDVRVPVLGKVHINAVVKEEDGKSCVTGYAEGTILGATVHEDFSKNCETINPA